VIVRLRGASPQKRATVETQKKGGEEFGQSGVRECPTLESTRRSASPTGIRTDAQPLQFLILFDHQAVGQPRRGCFTLSALARSVTSPILMPSLLKVKPDRDDCIVLNGERSDGNVADLKKLRRLKEFQLLKGLAGGSSLPRASWRRMRTRHVQWAVITLGYQRRRQPPLARDVDPECSCEMNDSIEAVRGLRRSVSHAFEVSRREAGSDQERYESWPRRAVCLSIARQHRLAHAPTRIIAGSAVERENYLVNRLGFSDSHPQSLSPAAPKTFWVLRARDFALKPDLPDQMFSLGYLLFRF